MYTCRTLEDSIRPSLAEVDGRANAVQPFLPTSEWLANAQAQVGDAPLRSLPDLYRLIWLGSFPGAVAAGEAMRDVFYGSYVQTYIQRDVRALARVGDELAFHRLLRAAAARTAQLVNYADLGACAVETALAPSRSSERMRARRPAVRVANCQRARQDALARDVDADQKTVKAWLSILQTSGIVHLLPPYSGNVTNRLVKTPKLYFTDTGLCAHLTAWSSPETLEAGAMSGAILETWIFGEMLKSYWHRVRPAPFYFYRDRDKREIDLVIEADGRLHPVEFKKTARPSRTDTRHFETLRRFPAGMGPGAVVCLRESAMHLGSDLLAIPAGLL